VGNIGLANHFYWTNY